MKTLFGDVRNVGTAALCVGAAALVLHTPVAVAAGVVLPVALLVGAAYLARY